MKANGRTCLICNCEGTMPLDAAKISDNINAEVGKPYSHLCRSQLSAFEAALSGEQDLVVACQQEAPLFQEIAEEKRAWRPGQFHQHPGKQPVGPIRLKKATRQNVGPCWAQSTTRQSRRG